MLLQIFDDGHLTDAKGRRVDFRNTIVIMTSNVGADIIRRDTTLGFQVKRDEAKTAEELYRKMKDKVLGELKNQFRPEFLNRIDGTVVFHALNKEHIRQIVDLMLREVEKQVTSKGMTLEVSETARDWIGAKGYDPMYGARPLRRVIQNEVEDRLSEALLEEKFGVGDVIMLDVVDDELAVTVRQPVLAT